MRIRTISTGQLRRMGDQEGLVLQGCGGDLQEWVDGINEILAQEGILKKGAGFEEAYTFRHDGLTCMLFPFKGEYGTGHGKTCYMAAGILFHLRRNMSDSGRTEPGTDASEDR